MYLNKLQIVNFRNLHRGSFNFNSGINTIIGENDSGKSNSITAIRMLLDGSYYFSEKTMEDNDFSFKLVDWRGHWIIISGEFEGISESEGNFEEIAGIIAENENKILGTSQIESSNGKGNLTVFIRPNKIVRKQLSEATTPEQFEEIRENISIYDYEIFYTGRSTTDFTDQSKYLEIVGDIENHQYINPDEDDTGILGTKIDIRSLQSHISVVTIDALRDVERELKKGKNPIRKIVEKIQKNINDDNLNEISNKISTLNESISEIKEIKEIGYSINSNLDEMIGIIHSPDLILQSQMHSDMDLLSRYISLKPKHLKNINQLGLGHLNMIYIALKLVEFEIVKSREILNIMLIEEPEAHIHNHIQKTLFSNMEVNEKYTQILMTTHSTHISETSEISRINVLKSTDNETLIMQPHNNLDQFGQEKLNLKTQSLTQAVERYLDVKRSVLMFAKSVILVEGDGEEIILPALVEKAFGLSLDELGVSIVNIGSVAFEYIASLYSDDRIRKRCAILTDSDRQAVLTSSTHYKKNAEEKGKNTKEKLNGLYGDNEWVDMFYSEYTLEIDLLLKDTNDEYIIELIEENYIDTNIKEYHKNNIKSQKLARKADTILTLTNKLGKGWFAILLAEKMKSSVHVPEYIVDALVFASNEIITENVILRIILYILNQEDTHKEIVNNKLEKYEEEGTIETYNELIHVFTESYPTYSATRFIKKQLLKIGRKEVYDGR